jgi:hypothetical protein
MIRAPIIFDVQGCENVLETGPIAGSRAFSTGQRVGGMLGRSPAERNWKNLAESAVGAVLTRRRKPGAQFSSIPSAKPRHVNG